MNFFKKMFADKPEIRKLTSVNQLNKDDIIVLTDSFALPENLRQKQFHVSAVNSYEYEHTTQTEWVLTGENHLEMFLTLEVDDKSYLKFALKVAHHDVETLFDLQEFSVIFDEGDNASLHLKSDTEKTQGWSSSFYQQHEFARVGYFHRKDHRTEDLSAYEGKDAGEQFELYTLYDEDESRGIDVEVWSDGDTDVFLTLYRPLTDIIDMYPGS